MQYYCILHHVVFVCHFSCSSDSSLILLNFFYYFNVKPWKVYYKQADAKFYPALAFAFAQSFVYYPMHISEGIVFGTMAYWSAGLSGDDLGSRFLIFILICIMFAICIAQVWKVHCSSHPSTSYTLNATYLSPQCLLLPLTH